MSQMNSDTTMDQFDDEFDASRAGASRKKGFIGLAAVIALAGAVMGARAPLSHRASVWGQGFRRLCRRW